MLKVLPSHISNLIAAGEVVQRPASVVKELMENSLDAKATQITVVINDSGKTLIQIIDNGCGMSKKEAELCFERHATSKIAKAEDLYSINTFGFRGEALASIAACAEVTLKTRKKGKESGTEVVITESSITSSTEVSCAEGSNFAIRNIFYNIPARRKFLKSDNVEYRQIVSEFTRVALTRIDVEFRLVHNSKDIFHLQPVTSQKQRIIHLCGKELAKDLVDLQTETSLVGISGFIGKPDHAKKNQPNQYFFVNGRYFRSPLLHKAVIKAYNNLIPDGSTPSYFIFLQIEPGELDVNIHPSKTEIKFENDNVIFEILNCAVKESIGGNSFMPGIDFDREGVPELPVIDTNYSNSGYVAPPKVDYDPLFNPFNNESSHTKNRTKWNSSSEWGDSASAQQNWEQFTGQEGTHQEQWNAQPEQWNAQPEQWNTQPEEQNSSLHREENQELWESSITTPSIFSQDAHDNKAIIQLKGRYIITTVKSGLMLIDSYRAKERILYERYLASVSSGNPGIQEHLFPQTIDLDHNSYSIIMENEEITKQLGFDIRSFGKDCVVVYGSPAALADESLNIEEAIDILIADLKDKTIDVLQELKERAAQRLINASSIYSAKNLSKLEASELIDALFSCSEPNISPSGKKCIDIISLEELISKL